MQRLFSTLYVSSAVRPFTPQELEDLLAVSRRNNEAAGVTGMLLYKECHFMQAVEGEPQIVKSLLSRISADPRHQKIVILVENWNAEREFPDWSMGFENLEIPSLHTRVGFSDFLNLPLTGREFCEDPSLAKRLLASFKRSAA